MPQLKLCTKIQICAEFCRNINLEMCLNIPKYAMASNIQIYEEICSTKYAMITCKRMHIY